VALDALGFGCNNKSNLIQSWFNLPSCTDWDGHMSPWFLFKLPLAVSKSELLRTCYDNWELMNLCSLLNKTPVYTYVRNRPHLIEHQKATARKYPSRPFDQTINNVWFSWVGCYRGDFELADGTMSDWPSISFWKTWLETCYFCIWYNGSLDFVIARRPRDSVQCFYVSVYLQRHSLHDRYRSVLYASAYFNWTL